MSACHPAHLALRPANSDWSAVDAIKRMVLPHRSPQNGGYRLRQANHVSSGPSTGKNEGLPKRACVFSSRLCACPSRRFFSVPALLLISLLVLPAVPCCPVLLVLTMHDRGLIGFSLHTICNDMLFFPFSFQTLRSQMDCFVLFFS